MVEALTKIAEHGAAEDTNFFNLDNDNPLLHSGKEATKNSPSFDIAVDNDID